MRWCRGGVEVVYEVVYQVVQRAESECSLYSEVDTQESVMGTVGHL